MKLDMIFESSQMMDKRSVLRVSYLLKKLFLLIVLIAFFTPNKTVGQANSYDFDGYAINPKIGFYLTSMQEGGFTYGGEVNYYKNKFLISADYYRIDEFVLFEAPAGKYNHLGIMIGSYSDRGKFRFQYQAGLGLLWGSARTNEILDDETYFLSTIYKSKDFLSVGFTPKLGFKIMDISYFRVGIDLQANINFEKSVFLPFLSVEVGIPRDN